MSGQRRWHIALWAVVVMLPPHSISLAEVMSVETDPPGTYLSIRGPVAISGNAPLSIGELPIGEYNLTASGPGLPVARGRLVRSASALLGRSWAGPTAFIEPPGLVHLQRGEQRGWVLMCAGGVAATLSVAGQVSAWNADDDLKKASRAYARAVSEDDISRTRRDMLATAQEKRDQEEVRNLWLGYLALTWLGAGAEAYLLTPQPTLSSPAPNQYMLTVPRAGSAKVGLRSALVPGAGQRFMGRDRRANVCLAATALLAAGAIAAHDSFLDARRDQADAQRRFDEAEMEGELRAASEQLQDAADKADRRSLIRWACVGAAAGTYLWNVIDAFGLGHSTLTLVPDVVWSVTPTSDGVAMCATWSIP